MKKHSKLATFKSADLPNAATHCDQAECGFSLYRGVLIQWDEDHDKRVLRVLDNMPAKVLDRLLVVQEHEGSIAFVWDGKVPKRYSDANDIEVPGGDCWCISSSISILS